MLRGTILDIRNQSYKNICHAVNICMDQITDIDLVEKIIDDLYDESLSVSYNQNLHQHDNHLNTIFSVENWDEFDILKNQTEVFIVFLSENLRLSYFFRVYAI